MSVIFKIVDDQPKVDVDESTPLDVSATRQSYHDVFIQLGGDKDQSINEQMMALASEVGETSIYDVRFLEMKVVKDVPVPASPPEAAVAYISDPANPALSDDEMMERFGWNASMMSSTSTEVTIVTPQFKE